VTGVYQGGTLLLLCVIDDAEGILYPGATQGAAMSSVPGWPEEWSPSAEFTFGNARTEWASGGTGSLVRSRPEVLAECADCYASGVTCVVNAAQGCASPKFDAERRDGGGGEALQGPFFDHCYGGGVVRMLGSRVRALAAAAGTGGDEEVDGVLENARAVMESGEVLRSAGERERNAVAAVFMVGRASRLRNALRQRCEQHQWVPVKDLAELVAGEEIESCPVCDRFCGITADEVPHVRRACRLFNGTAPLLKCPCGFRARLGAREALLPPPV
jgi:hypothetical protein